MVINMKAYKGKFRLESVRDILEFHTTNGEEFDVITTEEVPLETLVEATFEGNVLVEYKRDHTLLKAPSGYVMVALVRFLELGDRISDKTLESTARRAKQLQDEYRRMGFLDIIVKPHVINTYEGSRSLRAFNWSWLRNYLKENDPDTYYTHYHGWGGYKQGICGQAWLGGTKAWTYGMCGIDTMIHEQGHNFGLHHAGTPNGGEYGERDTYMGSNRRRHDMNTPHLYELNVIDPEDVKKMKYGEAGIFYLAQGSKNTLSLPPKVDKIVILDTSEHGNYRIASVSYFDESVRIHTPSLPNRDSFIKTTRQKIIKEGSHDEFEGIKVHFIEQKNDVAKVSIKYGNEEVQDNNTWPKFIVPEDNHVITSSISGVWRNSDWSAQGLHVRYLGKERSQLFVGWLSWNEDDKPEWLWSVMNINEGNFASGPLRSGKNASIVGEAQMYFFNEHEGNFRSIASHNYGGYFTFPVTRLSQGMESEINGFYGIGNGEGLSLELTSRNTVVGYIYTYYTRHRRSYTDWKMALGDYGEPLTIYDVDGGVRGIKADFKVTPEDGKLDISRLTTDGIITLNGHERVANRLA